MSDDNSEFTPETPVELRPVVARLMEIHRKCESLGSRNEEAEDMAVRLASIIDQLGKDPEDEDRLPYGELARQLFPVARLFESLGFMSVAKELAHVDKVLNELEPAGPPPGSVSSIAAAAMADDQAGDEVLYRPAGSEQKQQLTIRERLTPPKAVRVMILVLLLATLAGILILRGAAFIQNRRAAAFHATPTPELAAVATPNLAPTPTPDASGAQTLPTPSSRAVIAKTIGEARLAMNEGDIDTAIDRVSRAALLEPLNGLVVETAHQIITELMQRADAAADDGEWARADALLARARELAARFKYPQQGIDSAARRYSRMERFDKIDPTDRAAIRAAIGHRVLVYYKDGSTKEGWIHGVTDLVLQIDRYTEIGRRGGKMYFVEEIPLRNIEVLRVFEDVLQRGAG